MISVEGNKFVENELMFARNTVNILFKGCSHGTIATAIYFLQVMNLWDLVLLS